MGCNYIYNGVEYTKEEMIAKITHDIDVNPMYRSIATAKKAKRSKLATDVRIIQFQRYSDAKNMLQAVKNSSEDNETKRKKIAYYKGIMERTMKAIKGLEEQTADKQLDYILDLANIDFDMVNKMYDSDTITFSELQYANSIIETWLSMNQGLEIDNIFEIPSEEVRKKAIDIHAKFETLNQRSRSIAIKLIEDSRRGGKISEEEITKLVDTSFLTEWTRELTTTGIPLANKLSYIIKEINIVINKEHNTNHSAIDAQYEKIKNNSTFKTMGWDLFVKSQKNRSGEEVLGVVTRYSQRFWDNLRSVRRELNKDLEAAGEDKDKIKKAYKKFNAWNENHTVPFNALPFLEQDKYTDAQRNTEIARMKTLGFKESEIDNMVFESQKQYERFLSNKEDYHYLMMEKAVIHPETVPAGMSVEDYVKLLDEEYDNLNNPLKYMDQKFYGAKMITAYGGSKYSYLIAAKTVNGLDSGYYDDNFSKIAADPQLYEFYNWFTKFMKDNLSWFPQEEIEDLQSNFLPVMGEKAAKEYGLTAMKESVKGLGDWFMKALTSTDYMDKVEVNPWTRRERRNFKARFINENIAMEDRTKDLVIMAKMFSDMSLVYKHKNSVKAEVDTINDFIQDTKGSYKIDKFGRKIAQDKDALHIKELSDFTVRKGFYGIQSEDTLFKSKDLFYDWKELITLGMWKSAKGKKAQELSNKIDILTKEMEDEDLSEDEIKKAEETRNDLIESFYKLGGRKFSLTSTIDSMVGQTRLGALALSPFSAARNLLVGKINNRFHSAGGRDFNRKDLIWANRAILESSGKYWTAGKYETRMTKLLYGLMADAQLAEGEDGLYLKAMIDKKTNIDKFREMLPQAYTWLSSGDYHFKAEMLMACMKHDMIKTDKGDISFIDALNEDREFDEAKYGPWNAEKNGGLTYEEYYNQHLLKYKQLANKLHGASGRDAYIKIKDNAIGRLAILFKSWLPETVGVRFDPRHTDALLKREEEGYYRTLFRMIGERKVGIFKTLLQAAFNQDMGITDELTASNLRKVVKEMQVIAALMLAYMMLKAMAPDDDKKKKLYNLLVLRQLHDLNRDLTYYFSISSIGDLQREVFPIIRLSKNWAEAMKAAAYYGFGVENEDGDLMYDQERTALKITKVLPVMSNVNKVVYYQKQIAE